MSCAYQFAEGGDDTVAESSRGIGYDYRTPQDDLPRPSLGYRQDMRGLFGDELEAGLSSEAESGSGAAALNSAGRDTGTDIAWLLAGLGLSWIIYRS